MITVHTFTGTRLRGEDDMTDELYNLYKQDEDFKRYVDEWCKARNVSIFEAFRLNILQEYGKWIKEVKK